MKLYSQIFFTFAKIGLFTIGGGYAMLPFIQKEVVERKKWIDSNDFIDIIAISQTIPGIFAVNTAIFSGYRMKGNAGSIVATLGAILPSFVIILLIATCFRHFEDNVYVVRMFHAIRPAVVALIAVPVFSTAKNIGINIRTIIIPISVAFLIWYWGVSPIYIVIAAAAGGVLYGKLKTKN